MRFEGAPPAPILCLARALLVAPGLRPPCAVSKQVRSRWWLGESAPLRVLPARPSHDVRQASSVASAAHALQPPTTTLYYVQPVYYAEERDESLVWLGSDQARAVYRVLVRHNLLCCPEGVPLASETPTHFLYVVERSGRLLVASKTDQEPSVMRHSSLVAGAPVAAAGEMLVHCGGLLSLSNWSGHYAPPPSCLGVVLDSLARLGMTDLKDVKLDLIQLPTARESPDAWDTCSSTHRSENAQARECLWDPAQALKCP